MGFFLPRVLELHARALKLRQPVPVDPKVLSMRRSAERRNFFYHSSARRRRLRMI